MNINYRKLALAINPNLKCIKKNFSSFSSAGQAYFIYDGKTLLADRLKMSSAWKAAYFHLKDS